MDTVLKGCPSLGPPLLKLYVKRLGICVYTIYYKQEINFSSKVYSKSLLKAGSLKGSVVYSLILNYQFCACVMQVSGIPQLQVIHMKHLYGYK